MRPILYLLALTLSSAAIAGDPQPLADQLQPFKRNLMAALQAGMAEGELAIVAKMLWDSKIWSM